MTTSTYTVQGMTCGHCTRSVTEEISALQDVSNVEVDLEAGTAVVTGDAPQEAVRAAVAEAGYEVTAVR